MSMTEESQQDQIELKNGLKIIESSAKTGVYVEKDGRRKHITQTKLEEMLVDGKVY